ncbi:hypothetical protein L1N85_01785 [Paenibacillus alkaliterrae]|uniref:hypothetical protein n=1 Tax=Paenibacillus alkaliterrae TaxID=320909 RepID=UPI001F3F9558|nr:hypothetical protein [Paenibacillus alkaliterrae]MCF2937163.1 hypothetical protein [Paenibacillus alkaliterrae]
MAGTIFRRDLETQTGSTNWKNSSYLSQTHFKFIYLRLKRQKNGRVLRNDNGSGLSNPILAI